MGTISSNPKSNPIHNDVDYNSKINQLAGSTQTLFMETFGAPIFQTENTQKCKDSAMKSLQQLYGLLKQILGNLFSSCVRGSSEEAVKNQFEDLKNDISDLESEYHSTMNGFKDSGLKKLFAIIVAAIIGFFRTMVNFIKKLLKTIKDAITNAAEFFSNLFGSISKTTDDFAEEVRSAIGGHAHVN